LIGHDHPNEPANGLGNNGAFDDGQEPRSARVRQEQ
jgi:hypothetical protein